ncbi:MAG: glycosyltransferase [Candidatus Hadarchaeum sp.]|nr:glycosyltransferase [Thermofilum adornatum]
MKSGISIIIPNLNGEKVLPFCLRSLINQTLSKGNYEIIVIDNNSTDKSTQICETYSKLYKSPRIRCIKFSRNLGYGNAINIGAKYAQYKYILATNNDIIFHPFYLEVLLDTLEYVRSRMKNVVAAVGLHFYYPEVTCINSAGGLLSIVGGHYRYYGRCLGQSDFRNFMKQAVNKKKKKIFSLTGFGTGAALLIDRSIFMKIGGFYKLYFAGVEEFDLGLLLNLLGFRIIFVPTAVLFHRESFTFKRKGLNDTNKIKAYLPGNYIYVSTLIQGVDRIFAYLLLFSFSIFIFAFSLVKKDKNLSRSIIEVYRFITSDYFNKNLVARRAQFRITLHQYFETKKILKSLKMWKSPLAIIVDTFRSFLS